MFTCARFGGEGACPEDTHRPRSIEGRALAADAAAILRQSRASFSGFAGLDLAGCIDVLARRGHDPDILAHLLPAWEQGLKAAADAQRSRKET